MIDIDELRFSAANSVRDLALLPSEVLELIARLEAAEKERNDFAQQLVQSEQGRRKAVVERDALRDRLALESQESGALHEAVERACEERDALQAEVIHIKEVEFPRKVQAVADGWRGKCERLEAKITEMERQEPTGTLYDDGCFVWRNGRPHESNYAGWKMALYALPGAKEQEPTRDWWGCLIADISSIDCMYRGSPTYAHDAYWMREHVVRMLEQRRDVLPDAKGEEK